MRRQVSSFAVAAALTFATSFTGSPAAAVTPPTGACQQPPTPGQLTQDEIPWAQNLLGLQRAWQFSTGRGVMVAVIDSGTDTSQPQLSKPGKVLTGFDFLRRQVGADFDCKGHGTEVSSIIAASASPSPKIAFEGVAPNARILPVRVSDLDAGDINADQSSNDVQKETVTPGTFAESIRYAVDQGAKVINFSLTLRGNFPVVWHAIQYAERKDVVLVAAVGNDHGATVDPNTGALVPPSDPSSVPDTFHDLPEYPAAYPGVVGVGGIEPDESMYPASQRGSFVDLVAPADGITVATAVRGYLTGQAGTSFAAPFVAGTAALVRAEYPNFSARQVVQRMLQTADPAAGDIPSRSYGYGIVDPYRAVTENFDDANPAPAVDPPTLPKPDLAAARERALADARASHADNTVLLLAAAGGGIALLVAVAAAGRRRRWQPARIELEG